MARIVQGPFGRSLALGRVAGVQICAHWSLPFALALITWLLATQTLPAAHAGDPRALYWAVGLVTSVAFLAALLAHELAHAIVARHHGMPVQRTTLWLLGGLTELDAEMPSPRVEALVAGSGPATSLVLGGVGITIARIVGTGSLAGSAVAWFGAVNILLALFNALPAAPLDGGRLLHALVWSTRGDRHRADGVATTAGRVLGAVLVALGVLWLAEGNLGGMWLALIGWYLIGSAQAEANRAPLPAGLTAADVMDPAPQTAPSWWTVDDFLARLDPVHAGQPAFPLVDVDGRAVGGLLPADLLAATRAGRGADTLVRVTRIPNVVVVPTTEPLPDVITAVARPPHVLVVAAPDGHPVGVIDQWTLVRFLRALHVRELLARRAAHALRPAPVGRAADGDPAPELSGPGSAPRGTAGGASPP